MFNAAARAVPRTFAFRSAAAAAMTSTAANGDAVHPLSLFEKQADTYEAVRPSYPAAAIDLLFTHLRLKSDGASPPPRVLDLAAGTGKLTRQLVAAGAGGGASIVAVEPSPAMREQFARVLPGIEILDAPATKLPFGDGEFDAVIVGQAFHWFANEEAVTEFARVLKPGGGLALLWNLEDGTKPWTSELLAIYRTYAEGGTPNYALGTHKPALEGGAMKAAFDVAGSAFFEYTLPYTAQGVWDNVYTKSFIVRLPQEELDNVLKPKIDAWCEKYADRFAAPPGGDGGAPVAQLPYRNEVFLAMKKKT